MEFLITKKAWMVVSFERHAHIEYSVKLISSMQCGAQADNVTLEGACSEVA